MSSSMTPQFLFSIAEYSRQMQIDNIYNRLFFIQVEGIYVYEAPKISQVLNERNIRHICVKGEYLYMIDFDYKLARMFIGTLTHSEMYVQKLTETSNNPTYGIISIIPGDGETIYLTTHSSLMRLIIHDDKHDEVHYPNILVTIEECISRTEKLDIQEAEFITYTGGKVYIYDKYKYQITSFTCCPDTVEDTLKFIRVMRRETVEELQYFYILSATPGGNLIGVYGNVVKYIDLSIMKVFKLFELPHLTCIHTLTIGSDNKLYLSTHRTVDGCGERKVYMFDLYWYFVRLFFIAKIKEDPTSCPLSILSYGNIRDICKYILA